MRPKPLHLGPQYAAQFADPSVVGAYHLRPSYPTETFDILAALVVDEPRAVLDVSCGTGELARHVVDRVARVDALDPSAGMLEKGRGLPNGEASNLTWIYGHAEDAPIRSPYALIMAGASLHWMEWDVVLSRFRDALSKRGMLAIVNVKEASNRWDASVSALIAQSSTNRDFRPYDVVEELKQRDLFRTQGRRETAPVLFEQSLADYIESFHARNGFSRDRMTPRGADEFDRALRKLIESHSSHGIVRRSISASIVWGDPAP